MPQPKIPAAALAIAAAVIILVGIFALTGGVDPWRCALLTLVSLCLVAGIYLIGQPARGPAFYAVMALGLLGCIAFVVMQWMRH